MKTLLVSILAIALLCGSGPRAVAMDAQARDEIDYLIRTVETSGARFIRNGKEYSAQEGAAHLREKLQGAGDRIKTAEDFVVGVATKSYLSGKPYLMKSADGKGSPTGVWMSEELVKYRAAKKAKS